MGLHEVNEGIQTNRKRKRLGRGLGSGLGKTAGRGSKGQKSRNGYSRHPTFEGGNLPMVRRVPKRGFNNRFARTVYAINVGELHRRFDGSQPITPELLRSSGVVKVVCDEIKVLGDGDVTKKLQVVANHISQTAREKIEKAGGSVMVVAARRTPDERVEALQAGQG